MGFRRQFECTLHSRSHSCNQRTEVQALRLPYNATAAFYQSWCTAQARAVPSSAAGRPSPVRGTRQSWNQS